MNDLITQLETIEEALYIISKDDTLYEYPTIGSITLCNLIEERIRLIRGKINYE